MRNLLLLFLVSIPLLGLSQGTTCAGMDPICANAGVQFPLNTATNAAVGNDYGCLLTQPNPSWYYIEVSTAGPIDLSLSAPNDVDFILYGPYTNLAAAQGDCGSLAANDIVDCSYSASATETPSIPNGQVGEVYIMMITNVTGATQDATVTQTGGTGATDCSNIASPPCFMSFFEANISACDPPTDTYEITGVIDFEDPPLTGNLIVEDCNGNQVIVASAPFTVNAQGQGSETYTLSGLNADGQACDVSAFFSADPTCSIMNLAYTAPICNCFINFMSTNQEPCNTVTNTFDVTGTLEFVSPPTTGTLTFTDCLGNSATYNAPFTSPLNWAITGITPNGTTNCEITVTFSADPACTFTSLPFNHPADCSCPVDAGTFTTSITGSSTSVGPFALCFGDSLTITPNGDFIPPNDIGNPMGGTYNPGMHLLIYDCPPTIFSPQDFTVDPCFLGIWDPNNPQGPWGVNNIFGDNNTYYFMPLTLYDYVNYIYSFFTAGVLCYDLGPAYPVTLLEPILTNTTEDCFAGTATTTISGGTPANDGSQFNVVPGSLTPANANFVNTSASNGGTITIDGLVDGDNYSFEVQDDNGCPVVISGTFQGTEDASFTYDPRYCIDDADPSPNITGVPGGTFSVAPAGMSINVNTGIIDVSASTPGVYTITYQSPAANCWGIETFVVEINPLPVVVATEDSPICDDGVSTILLGETGGEATEWFWTTSGGATFDDDSLQAPTVTGATNGETFTVTATNTITGCVNTDAVSVTVNPLEDPTFTLTDFCFGDANAANVTGTPGGTFSFNPDPLDGAVVNTATGEITNEVAGTTYNIQYLTGGLCKDSLTLPVTVNALPTVSAPDQTICEGDNVNITATGANTYSWSPGTDLNTTTGPTVNASPTATINYTVTGTDANGCISDDVVTVTVNPLPLVDPIADQTLCNGDVTAVVNFTSTTPGSTFDWTNNTTSIGLAANGTGNIASFNVTNAGATQVTATITVTATANGCTGPAETFDIIVNPIPTVDPINDQEWCEGDNTTAVNFTGSVAGTSYDWTNTNTTIGLGANGNGNIASFVSANGTGAPIVGTVNVTPSAAGCVGTAEVFTITVNPLPTATIAGTIAVCENAAQPTVTFTGFDGVEPYTFTYNINGGAPQQVVSTGNSATVSVPTNVTGTFDYNLVSVEDASVSGCLNNVPSTVTVTVNPNPTPTITGTLSYCTGTPATLGTANAYNGYLWSNGATTPTSDFTIADNPITVTVTDANGCQGTSPAVNVIENTTIVFPSVVEICQGDVATIHGQPQTVAGLYEQTFPLPTGCDSTSSVTLIVNPLPVIDAGLDIIDCQGAGVTLTAVGAPNIVWDVPGVNNGVQFFPNVGTATYTATGTDANGCVNTDAVDVTINPNPNVDPIADQVVCNGDATATVTFNGAVPGTTYDWVNTDPTIGLAANGNGDILTFNAVNAGITPIVATITVTPTANGCQGATESFTITVNPTPIVDPLLDQIVCNGDLTAPVNFVSGTAGTTFDWTNSDPSIGLVANGAGNVNPFNAVNVGATPVVATISVTPTANTCIGTAVDFTITVNPSPTVDPIADQTVCNGVLTAPVNFTSPNPGATFDWTNSNTSIGLGANGTGNIPAFPGANSGGAPISGTITVTPTVNGCQGAPETFVITVDTPPTVDPIPNQEVCVGDNTTAINFTSPTPGVTFDWANDNTGIGLGANGTGNIASFAGTNAGGAPITGNIGVIPTLNGCIGQPVLFTITVNPLPNVNAGADVTVCDGDPVTLTATGANTYDWVPLIANGQPFVPAATGTYTVTGTDVNGCVNTDDVLVTVEPLPLVSFTADTTQGCEGLSVTFTNTTPGNFADCFWSFGNGATATGCGSVTITFDDAGTFDATLTTVSATGCTNTVTYTDYIYIEDDPIAAFTPSQSVVSLFDSEISFNNNSSGAVSYLWDFGDGSPNSTQENPTHQFPSEEAGGYTVELVAYSPLGCTDTARRVITINEELIFYIPNTFTPDNDDFNQTWNVVFTSGFDPFDFNLFVFNRWGEVIWESHDASVGWDATYGTDGRPVQDGTYTWKIDFKTTMSDERVQVVGHVNVLR